MLSVGLDVSYPGAKPDRHRGDTSRCLFRELRSVSLGEESDVRGDSFAGNKLGAGATTWLLPVATNVVFVLLALRTRTEDRVVFGNIIKVVIGNGYTKIREVS